MRRPVPQALALLALLACRCHTPPATPSEYARAAQAEATTPLSGALPASYAQPYASGLRSSRVGVAPGHYTSLTRVEVGWPPSETGTALTPGGVRLTPRFVLVPPDAAHLAVDWGARFDLRDADGAPVFLGRKERGFDLAASDGAAFVHGNELAWNGRGNPSPGVPTGTSHEGAILAMRYDGDRRVLVVENLPDGPPGRAPWSVQVSQDRFTTPDHGATARVASNAYTTRGVAAVAGDFRVVLATADRVLRAAALGGRSAVGPGAGALARGAAVRRAPAQHRAPAHPARRRRSGDGNLDGALPGGRRRGAVVGAPAVRARGRAARRPRPRARGRGGRGARGDGGRPGDVVDADELAVAGARHGVRGRHARGGDGERAAVRGSRGRRAAGAEDGGGRDAVDAASHRARRSGVGGDGEGAVRRTVALSAARRLHSVGATPARWKSEAPCHTPSVSATS